MLVVFVNYPFDILIKHALRVLDPLDLLVKFLTDNELTVTSMVWIKSPLPLVVSYLVLFIEITMSV